MIDLILEGASLKVLSLLVTSGGIDVVSYFNYFLRGWIPLNRLALRVIVRIAFLGLLNLGLLLSDWSTPLGGTLKLRLPTSYLSRDLDCELLFSLFESGSIVAFAPLWDEGSILDYTIRFKTVLFGTERFISPLGFRSLFEVLMFLDPWLLNFLLDLFAFLFLNYASSWFF